MLNQHMAGYRNVPTVARVKEITHMPLKTSPTDHEQWCIREVINQMDHHAMPGLLLELGISPRQLAQPDASRQSPRTNPDLLDKSVFNQVATF